MNVYLTVYLDLVKILLYYDYVAYFIFTYVVYLSHNNLRILQVEYIKTCKIILFCCFAVR